MTELMNLIAKKKLYKVSVLCRDKSTGTTHVETGELYAATDVDNASDQALTYWQKEQGYDAVTTFDVECIERVGQYKVVLVEDEQA